jgi:hypothetical protein
MSYPLSRIERGTRGELRKAMKTCQLWTFSPDFFTSPLFYGGELKYLDTL